MSVGVGVCVCEEVRNMSLGRMGTERNERKGEERLLYGCGDCRLEKERRGGGGVGGWW